MSQDEETKKTKQTTFLLWDGKQVSLEDFEKELFKEEE
jgi:hypothetical protein